MISSPHRYSQRTKLQTFQALNMCDLCKRILQWTGRFLEKAMDFGIICPCDKSVIRDGLKCTCQGNWSSLVIIIHYPKIAEKSPIFSDVFLLLSGPIPNLLLVLEPEQVLLEPPESDSQRCGVKTQIHPKSTIPNKIER